MESINFYIFSTNLSKKKKKKARHTSKVNTIKMMQKNRLRILTGKTHPKIKLKQL